MRITDHEMALQTFIQEIDEFNRSKNGKLIINCNNVNIVSGVREVYGGKINTKDSSTAINSYNNIINYNGANFSMNQIMELLNAKDDQLKAKDVQIARLMCIIDTLDQTIINLINELRVANENRIKDLKELMPS